MNQMTPDQGTGYHVILAPLRRSPGLRGLLYLGACAVLPRLAPAPLEKADAISSAANAAYASLVVLSVTHAFSLAGDDRYFHRKHNSDLRKQLRQVATGAGIGASTFVGLVSVAYALDWVSFQEWGWQRVAAPKLATALALLFVEYGAVAVTEEVIFRGYALRNLQLAIGTPLAAAFLTGLFAFAHGTEPLSLIGQTGSGLLLMAVRLTSGSLWMPIGCHLGISYAQTALLGPTDGPPSLLPMQNHGPKLWLGRPGYPEPGLLAAIMYVIATLGVVMAWLRHKRRVRTPR